MDEMIRQLVALSSKVAVLEAERPRVTRVGAQRPEPEARGLPSGVKAPPPPSFHGASDGDTVKNFIDALDTYFELVGMNDLVQKARFASVLLEGKARTWFTVQGYSFDEDGDALEWPELRQTLLMTFRPADFERVARKKLQAVK